MGKEEPGDKGLQGEVSGQSVFLLDAVEEDRRVAPKAVVAGEQRNVGTGMAGLRQTGIDFWRSCWEACQLDVGELGRERCG